MSILSIPSCNKRILYTFQKLLFIVLSFVGLAAASSNSLALTSPYVRIDTGFIQGQYLDTTSGGSGLYAFKGIPYAKPPVGNLRWRPPQPAEAWAGIKDTTAYGAVCMQPDTTLVRVIGERSEDCLTLNVWTAANPGDKRPVMVWIHGGGYSIGAGSQLVHNGLSFAESGAVLVNFNYRLGPFGFMAHPALSAETSNNTSGNYGLLDQIAALQWVKRNIAAFGGDPENVTIFGESAGGISVATLLVAPMAKGLFNRAIMESGVMEFTTPLRADSATPSGESLGVKIAANLGITNPSGGDAETAAELRARSADEVLAAAAPRVGMFGTGNKIYPVIDGYVLPHTFEDAVTLGDYNKVPVILGLNADEGTFFLQQLTWLDTPSDYRFFLQVLFGDNASRVEAMFPVSSDVSNIKSTVADVITTSAFAAPARRTARLLAQSGTPVWLYHFTRVADTLRGSLFGATHGAEVFYVFKTMTWDDPSGLDKIVSDSMHTTWLKFAATGNPNHLGLPIWPRYFASTDLHMEFGDDIKVGDHLWQDACDLFDDIYYQN